MVETKSSSSFYENEVFVSYAWGGESERTVNDLEKAFAGHGIHIIRDKKDLRYKGSIKKFEERIGRGQCVILVISDRYLRSEHCMYELVEVEQNQSIRERIFPIVLRDAQIYDAIGRVRYIKYWEKKTQKLNSAIKRQIDIMTGIKSISRDMETFNRIRDNFDHLADILSDMNALTPQLHAANGFSTLISSVTFAMSGKQPVAQPGKGLISQDESSNNKSVSLLNPFIYGRALRPDEFINRENELRTVFNRLRNSESTVIVGEPHIGKSSFLAQMADERTQMIYLSDSSQEYKFCCLNSHYSDNSFTPAVFWKEVLEPLEEVSERYGVVQRLKQVVNAGYESRSLDELFNYLDGQKFQLVLLLDEFDRLLQCPNFQEFSFYATLRAVAAYRSFSLVLASRHSLVGLQDQAHKLPFSGGSPVFNFLMELRLKPFNDKNVEAILSQAGNAFSTKDKSIIQFTAGHHPYLVQTMAAKFIEMTDDAFRYSAIEAFCSLACSHFDDVWNSLSDRERTTLIALGLVECGKCKFDDFEYNKIQNLANFGAGLHILHDLGIAERVDERQLLYRKPLVWQGEKWILGSQAFVCWVYQVVIAETQNSPALNDWIQNKRYLSLLSSNQWEQLVDEVRRSVGPQVCNIGLMIENRFKQFN